MARKRDVPDRDRAAVEPQPVPEPEEAAGDGGQGAPFPIVGIGASAGGLEASTELLRNLPTDTGMAFVFVHHLAAEHESVLAEILARTTSMPVTFAEDGMRVLPDHVYVAPPGAFVGLFHGTMNLMRPDPEPGARTAIDYFLRSLAEDQRNLSIGVVMSGTGSDGAAGIRALKAEDGLTFAQDPTTASYDNMPRAAIETGMVDFVLSPGRMAEELVRVSKHPYLRPDRERMRAKTEAEEEARQLDRIFLVLRETAGVDFAYYKPTTIRRRIARRMVVHRLEKMAEYAALLEARPDEVNALYQDLLINVTGFFREPETFEVLKTAVFPRLMEHRGAADAIRIWVPGCSTGEEPYSIAMALTEFLETQKVQPPIQVFATDVSDTSIEKARLALYPETIESEMSPERLSRFFTRSSAGYQLNKVIRDSCVFAKHDVTRDPPFSRLDLISCRNLLIYLGSVIQRRLIPVFHYALTPAGFLLLGSSESIGEYTNLFTPIDQKVRVYSKIAVASRPPLEFGIRPYAPQAVQGRPSQVAAAPVARVIGLYKEADRVAMDRYVPPGVLIDDQFNVVQFRGDTSPFFRHAPGRATLSVLEMARSGLDSALKSLLPTLDQSRGVTRMEGVHVRSEGHPRTVDIEAVPVRMQDQSTFHLLFFRDALARPAKRGHRGEQTLVAGEATDQLRRELEQTRDQLNTTVEEKDASVEELRAANEEIQSSNEELQSINEELETAKEELQSTNEELRTVNEELQTRNFQLQSMNDDLRNVLASVDVPIIIVGKDFRIRRYTPMAERVLNLIPSDVGRPITDLKLKLDVPDLPKLLKQVLSDLAVLRRAVRDEDGHAYRLEVRPYRTTDDRIEGVVIALLDVSDVEDGPVTET